MFLELLGLLQMSGTMRSSGSPEPDRHLSFGCPDNCITEHAHSSQLSSCAAATVLSVTLAWNCLLPHLEADGSPSFQYHDLRAP